MSMTASSPSDPFPNENFAPSHETINYSRLDQSGLMSGSTSIYGRFRSWLLQEEASDIVICSLQNCSNEFALKKVENVRMLDRYHPSEPAVGTLYLTPTHLIFVDPDKKKETWILYTHIASIEKLPLSTAGSSLRIRCKTFLLVTFVIPRESDCHEMFVSLQKLSQPARLEDLYCFRYTSSSEDIPKQAGWSFFDLQAEYQRMKVPNDEWSLTLLNQDYELCDTYPKYLYVPSSASTNILVGSSKFRSKGRLPVLCYLHSNKASISRCSQPLSGFSARCLEDEKMLNCILKTNPNFSSMYVADTRPMINAMANRATGKGYENENFYENIKFQFFGVENIHIMRSSLGKLIETCEQQTTTSTMNNFLSGLESSGWLRHVKAIFDAAFFIAQAVSTGVSVVVHCSDGWDRTAQVCSLSSLLLDPYYRTIQGYQALIEKDWLAFGHKFSDRYGHIAGDPKEVSPVFTQFIEATWHLAEQYPRAFQFNENFLLTLHDHLSSCQFGTFIGNCEKDRIDLRLNERTFSLWGFMANHMSEYMNPLYAPEQHSDLLKPNLAPQNFKFWRGMYCRFESGVHPRENVSEYITATNDHSNSLEDHVRFLHRKISLIKSKLSECGGKVKSSLLKDSSPSIENKFFYNKVSVLSNLNSFDDPLGAIEFRKTESESSESQNLEEKITQITSDLESVALDWKTLRSVQECSCSAPFDHFTKKNHCWKCGNVFCTRCIDKHTALPGHLSQNTVPVCRPCYKLINQSPPAESPQ
nr:PREDICTED: myotubularin-related protein 6 isoform X1 [Bemisia tabaci]